MASCELELAQNTELWDCEKNMTFTILAEHSNTLNVLLLTCFVL